MFSLIRKLLAPARVWKHPTLGRFCWHRNGWSKDIDIPAFNAFSYRHRYDHVAPDSTRHKLVFADRIPSDDAVQLGSVILNKQADIVRSVIDSLWSEYTTQRYAVGIGDMETIADVLRRHGNVIPTSQEELLPLLQLAHVTFHSAAFERSIAIAELNFHSALEPEHGLGLLTDGLSILGIGFFSDVMPFDWKPASPRFGPNGSRSKQ